MSLAEPNVSETLGGSGVLAVEEIARHPLPGMSVPDQLSFSPDDRLITYLASPERSLVRQLFVFDPATGAESLCVSPPGGGTTEENVSIAEQLRRERLRQREVGVTTYTWAPRANRLCVPIAGSIHVVEGAGGELRELVPAGDEPIHDPTFSPDGENIAFVQGGELLVVPFAGGAPRQITSGAREAGVFRGLAEYVAQEEMERHRGFWWSPDAKSIAFTEVDERHVPVYRIVHQGKDATGPGAEEDHHYPFAGKENARVKLGVVPAKGGDIVWMDLDRGEEIYLARVHWLVDGRLAAEIQNRAQTWLELVVFDLATGARTRLLREETNVWINLHRLFRPLSDGGFLWASERTGFRHLYRYDKQGKLLATVTRGEWLVDDVRGIDEKKNLVYFTASAAGPLESHLYAAPLDVPEGGEPRRITTEPGIHNVVLDRACKRFVDTHHNIHTPPTVRLCSLDDGAVLGEIHTNNDPRVTELPLSTPELVTMKARDGETLHGALYRPPRHFGPGPHPTIIFVYGGPHVQLVTNGWNLTVTMRPQYLRSLGYLVFVLDNRGSARRGLSFEGKIKHRMGSIEVDDQVDGVRWLVEKGLADPARVGVYGWSYGGYMAAMCLARAPETFKVAVSGAPVTHWDGYDTHYTERYMGLPSENVGGYEESSVMFHAKNIQGKLLLVHGLIDENVHFRHTARLINAMIAARKPYDLLLFPDERHMPRRSADKVYMEELIRDYFGKNL